MGGGRTCRRVGVFPLSRSDAPVLPRRSSEFGTRKTVTARFWPWLSDRRLGILSSCSLFPRLRGGAGRAEEVGGDNRLRALRDSRLPFETTGYEPCKTTGDEPFEETGYEPFETTVHEPFKATDYEPFKTTGYEPFREKITNPSRQQVTSPASQQVTSPSKPKVLGGGQDLQRRVVADSLRCTSPARRSVFRSCSSFISSLLWTPQLYVPTS